MDQIQQTSTALAELTDSLRPEEPREVLLARVASRVVALMPDADAVTVTLLADGRPSTVAATEQSLVRLDEAQYAAEDGPCLEALRKEAPVQAGPAELRERWPAFAELAQEAGVGTLLSCPLFLPADGAVASRRALDHRLSGALNVWSFRQGAFAPVEYALVAMFTSAMSSIILTAARWTAAQRQADGLLTALETRDAIATAKGIVMVRRELSIDDAFQWLVDASQRTNRKIRDLALLIIDEPALVGSSS
ncbi:GAF and ANTAR domain-containing protein [Actinophytocola sp.]|uniref:GAF and ANTAR domain-containing protein n=1 Tax=Actinophytocola sp. TaxID=1872138 RepID=UPI00389B29AA